MKDQNSNEVPETAAGEKLPEVTVPKWETREQPFTSYTVYALHVAMNGRSWFIYRRYNEFYQLNEVLRKNFPDQTLDLPGKRLVGNMRPEFVESRRQGLNQFVQRVLSRPTLVAQDYVQDFFAIKSQKKDSFPDEPGEQNEPDHDDPNLPLPGEKKVKPADFKFLKTVGKGSFGKVYLAVHKDDVTTPVAVKVIKKEIIKRQKEVRHVMNERNALVRSIQHPFLVTLHYSFQTTERLFFVMDYVNGGELFMHLQRERNFDEPRARFYAAEIASALGYLHSCDIIYRDLKPENLLLDAEGHIQLADFGLCKEGMKQDDTTNTFCGTPEYLAPEVIRKKDYDKTVDWWCLGCVLYEMLFGLPPFYSKDHQRMYKNILNEVLRFPNHTRTTMSASGILTGLLQKDPFNRLGALDDFVEIRAHSFFACINFDDLDAKRLPVPYRPSVRGLFDVSNVEDAFKREQPSPSLAQPLDNISVQITQIEQNDPNAFSGFSYVNVRPFQSGDFGVAVDNEGDLE